MTQFKWSSLTFTQKLLDLGVLLVALLAAAGLTHPEFERLIEMVEKSLATDLLVAAVLLIGWSLGLSSLSLYGSRRLARRRDDLVDVMRAVGLCAVVLAAIAQVANWAWASPRLLLGFWAFASIALVATRLLKRAVLRQVRLRGRNLRQVIIVGTGERAQRMAGVLNDHPELGYYLLGFVDNRKAPGVLGPFNQIAQILADHAVDEILVALPVNQFYEEINEVLRMAEEQGVVVHIQSDLFDLRLARARAGQLDDVPVVTLSTTPSVNRMLGCKRLIDILGATAGLTIFAPVMLVIAALVKLTDRGPVFFTQERVGLNKHLFPMLKFRTMVVDAEARMKELEALNEADGPAFKLKHDPRVTPVGRFLRQTSLDELPQLFNVLRGDISLVGPRPLPMRDYKQFGQYWFNRRFSVKPGITCIWQVSGRNNTSFDRWIRQDLEYIDNWSLALDLKLLLKTIPAVLRGTGAM
jgi:exopolysaccharide biosynthesis polyprenyl glycosylphosphotransferase